jgi:hypothetical protein
LLQIFFLLLALKQEKRNKKGRQRKGVIKRRALFYNTFSLLFLFFLFKIKALTNKLKHSKLLSQLCRIIPLFQQKLLTNELLILTLKNKFIKLEYYTGNLKITVDSTTITNECTIIAMKSNLDHEM